jgi:hypothetical protein
MTAKGSKISQTNSKEPVLEKINNHKKKWTQHVSRMDRSRLPKAIMKHQPLGKRDSGNPLRLMDCYIETGAGQRPKSLRA